MKKIILLVILSCLYYSGYSQSTTAATYALSTQNVSYSSVSGGTVAATVAADDAAQTGIPIGFTFVFCGTSYTQLAANSNGFLSLANSNYAATSYINSAATLNLIGAGRGVLMPFWDDLNGSAAGANSTSCSGVEARYTTTGSAPNRVFTFEWFNWGLYHNTGASTPAGCGSFEVKLYETTNIIEFHYSSGSFTGTTATIGIANSNADFFNITNNVIFPPFSTATFNSAITTTPATGIVYRFCPQNIRTTASNGGPYCSATTASFTGTGTGSGASFAWAGPSSFSSTVLNPTIPNVTVAATGIYTFTGTIGTCTANDSTLLTVNPTPTAIIGPDSVCVGSSISLTDALGGGTFTSGTPGIGNITGGGVATGVSAGTTVITYTIPSTGCDTFMSLRVDALPAAPAAIGGANNTCQGSSTALTDATPGGVWSSSNTAVASVDGSGNVFGVGFGSATISYTVTNIHGCQNSATLAFTVNLFTLGPITGANSICQGSATTLSDIISGGVWSTSNASIASVDPSTGSVTGVSVGAATITYTLTNSCGTLDSTYGMTVVVTPTVSPITGTTTFCQGSTSTLNDATSGGVWETSNASVASVDLSGVVTGVAGGSATISYTVTNACGPTTVTTAVTINPLPVAGTITGVAPVCVGSTITLGETSSGGTWSTGNASIASVDGSGNVTGVSAGLVTIFYTVTNGCGTLSTSTPITVNPLPTAGTITGTTTICLGGSSVLSDATSGGTFTTADASIATIDPSGNAASVSVGTTTISYSVTTSCGTAVTTTPFTVNTTSPSAGVISGVTTVCPGSSSSLSSTVAGGVWSTSDATIASVNTSGGVFGVASGSATITYTVTTACGVGTVTTAYTVTSPIAHGTISGITTLCVGNTIALTESVSGGSWSISNPAIATITGAGVITGVGAGTARISYVFSNACFITTDTASISVLSASSAGLITGLSAVCQGGTTTLTDGITGGAWSSSDNSIASINSSLGIVLGISLGNVTMSYSVTDACGTTSTTFPMTVLTTPVAGTITGASALCIGHNTTLVDTTSGGTWSSSNTSVATISNTGVVTGLSAGSATISYMVANICGSDVATFSIAVDAFPNAGTIVGTRTLCAGATSLYTDTATGGTWGSSNTALATVDASGNVTGVSAGLVNIYYSITNACGSTNVTIAVNITSTPGTGTITGPATLCQGASVTLTDTATGGAWSSSNALVATVSNTGVVTGTGGGSVTISYALTNGCGTAYATSPMTINPLLNPGVVGGGTTLCIGSTATMSETVAGGVWSSSNTAIATVGSTGVVTAVGGGTATISYTVTNSCGPASATATIVVSPATNAGAITGAPSVCNGFTTTLTDTATGGTWSTSNAAVASVSTSGVVTGVSIGSATISYTVTDACGTATTTTSISVVAPLTPSAISGTTTLCAGSTTSLTATLAGGVWNSADTTIATVSSTGLVTGISGGSVIISYTNTNACGMAVATAFVTVVPPPTVGAINGPSTLCMGVADTMTDTTASGVWSSSDGSVVVIGVTSGITTALSVGSAILTYTYTGACGTTSVTQAVTIGTPPTDAGMIGGFTSICPGDSIGLSETVPSGVWSSSDNTIATVGISGIVYGLVPGTDTISYTVTNSCGSVSTTFPVTVNVSSASGTISVAATTLCAGTTDTLTDTTSGGTWSSSDATIATVDGAGVVTGISSGAVTISYTVSNSCGTSSATITLNILPSPILSSIIGPTILCESTGTTLSDTYFGGTWSSSNTAIATISPATGIATGLSLGTVTITYAATNIFGCSVMVTSLDTVNPAPHAGSIVAATGTTFCAGTTLALSDTAAGGTGIWTSSNTSVATVDASGLVTGVSAGTADISYAVTNGCGTDYAIANLTVNPQPTVGPIIGPTAFCSGVSATLVSTTFGGTWGTSNAAIATIEPSTGIITGLAAGNVTISYTAANIFGCSTTVISLDTIHLSADPGLLMVSGTTLCAGTSILFTDTVSGGTWSSSDTTVATVDASGLVTSHNSGTATISYSVTGAYGCDASVTAGIIVDPSPTVTAISGPTSMCYGGTLTLTDTTASGVWSSSDATIAIINASTGVVSSASAAGTVTLSYTITNGYGCSVSATQLDTISFAPLVTAISGPATMCTGNTINYTDGYTGGVWSSSDTTIATVDALTGDVTALSAGTVTITYMITASSSCFTIVTTTITVNASPVVAPITGPTNACVGATITLSDVTTGGGWVSDDLTIATVNTTGDVTGLATGIVHIYYTLTTGAGCSTSVIDTITIHPLPVIAAIIGTGNACLGEVITLSDDTTGGVWSSSNTSVITIDPSTGAMTGVTMSSATISYTVTNSFGCSAFVTIVETVNAIPTVSAITGAATICAHASITLSDATSGGTWSSGTTAIATVGAATGTVTGVAGGSANISYTVTNAAGCYASATTSMSINPAPILDPISGPTAICAGTAITYTEDSTGGAWSTSAGTIASVSTSGVVTGVAVGSATISYTKSNSLGCSSVVTLAITVNASPSVAAISGASSVCQGSSITLTDATTGGTWGTGDAAIASVDASTGTVTGTGSGIVNIGYTVSSGGCTAAVVSSITVNPLPTVAAISGASGVCLGTATTLTDVTTGGIWSSSNTSVATISTGGVVTGVTTGTATITYALTNSFGCTREVYTTISVNAAPSGTLLPTSGSLTLCHNAPVNIVVSGASSTSTFQWYNGGVAIAGATNSSYTTDTVGVYTVTVTEGGCSITLSSVTVNPSPNAVILHGSGNILYTGSFATYQWYLNGTPIAGATSSLYHTSSAGSYIVVVSDGNGCRDTSLAYVVSGTGGGSGVNTVNVSDIRLFPNPTSSLIRIDAPVKVNVSVLSPDGKVLIHEIGATSIDVSNLANGMYVIMVYDEYDALLKVDKFIKID